MKRIVILLSGRGSNMEAIVQRCAEQGWPARVVAVLSNRPDAEGLAFAARHGITIWQAPELAQAMRGLLPAAAGSRGF